MEHIDACFVFMSTLSWVCVVFYTVHQETQSKHVSKSDFGFGKMENLEPINFPIPVIWFTGSMRTEFHHVVVFSLKKIPISHHFFFKMNCIQMALTATMSGLMSDRVHPKVDVIWLVNFDIPTIKMDLCIFLPAVTCTFLKGLNFPWNGYPTQYNHTLRLVVESKLKSNKSIMVLYKFSAFFKDLTLNKLSH